MDLIDTERLLAHVDNPDRTFLGISGPEARLISDTAVILDSAIAAVLDAPDGIDQIRAMGFERLAAILER